MNKIEFSRLPKVNYGVDEAINTLSTNLTFAGSEVKSIIITSTKMGEGKSFISINVAKKLSELGKKVVLLDADLRRSRMDSRYGSTQKRGKYKGLTHYLAGLSNIDEIVYSTNIPGMLYVPIGREVSNSLALLSDRRFSKLLELLEEQADYVIVDAPPIGVIIDAAEIAKSCDGALIVVKYNQIRRREIQSIQEQIEKTGCKILGAVINGVTLDTISSKRYYHSQYTKEYYNSSTKPLQPVSSRRRSARE